MSEIKDALTKWETDSCVGTIRLGSNPDIERAMNISGAEIKLLGLVDIDEIILNLSNYLVYLAKEMGTLYARVKYLDSIGSDKVTLERVKLSIIKPVHDALRIKLDMLKTIYNGRLRSNYVGSSRS